MKEGPVISVIHCMFPALCNHSVPQRLWAGFVTTSSGSQSVRLWVPSSGRSRVPVPLGTRPTSRLTSPCEQAAGGAVAPQSHPSHCPSQTLGLAASQAGGQQTDIQAGAT